MTSYCWRGLGKKPQCVECSCGRGPDVLLGNEVCPWDEERRLTEEKEMPKLTLSMNLPEPAAKGPELQKIAAQALQEHAVFLRESNASRCGSHDTSVGTVRWSID